MAELLRQHHLAVVAARGTVLITMMYPIAQRLPTRRLISGLPVILGAALLLGACGSSAKVDTPPASVGQQLQDLEKARSEGLLTEAEYQQQRKRILEGK